MKITLVSLFFGAFFGVCTVSIGSETPNPYQPPKTSKEAPLFETLKHWSHITPRSKQTLDKVHSEISVIRSRQGLSIFEDNLLNIGAGTLATLDLAVISQALALVRPRALRRLRNAIPDGLEKSPFSELLNLYELYAAGSLIESTSFFPSINTRSQVLALLLVGGGAAGFDVFSQWLAQLPGPTLLMVIKGYTAGALATLLTSAAWDNRPIVRKFLAVRQFNEAIQFAMDHQLSVAPEIQIWKQDRAEFLQTCQTRLLAAEAGY
jgi:hypothetical protein